MDISEVTDVDVRAFISAKNIRTTCNECGQSAMALATQRQGRTPSILSMDPGEPDITDSIVDFYYQLICLNCGNVRLFELAHVLNWKLEQTAE